jgi:hypothetical protein
MSALKLSPFKSRTILSNSASSGQTSASAESAGWLFQTTSGRKIALKVRNGGMESVRKLPRALCDN